MKSMLVLGILAIGGVVALMPDAAEAQKKDKKNPVNRASPEEYQHIRNWQEITGKIAFADESSKMVSLRVDIPQVQANNRPKKGRPNPFKNPGNAYKVVKTPTDFDLTLQDKASVRQMFVSAEYDDKGFLKDNQEQQKTLRAKGYIPVKIEDVKAGMTAKLYLTPPKAGAKDEAAKPSVRMVVLLQAPNNNTAAPPKKNK